VAGQAVVTLRVSTEPAGKSYEWTSYDEGWPGDPQTDTWWQGQNPGQPFTTQNSGGEVQPGIRYHVLAQAVDGKRKDPTPAKCTMLVRPDGAD
jgi:hypothetical protein